MTSLPIKPGPWRPPSPLPDRRETSRLLLRFYEDSDALLLHRAVESSRASLLPWLPWAELRHRSVEDSLKSIELFTAARHNWQDPTNAEIAFIMGIFDKRTGELVGGTGFNRIDPATHTAEMGYWIGVQHRRRGFATEATAGMLSWALAGVGDGGWGFRRVHIFAASANSPSCGVPAKLGLRQESRLLQHRWVEGFGWTDTLGWGILASEWDCAHNKPLSKKNGPA